MKWAFIRTFAAGGSAIAVGLVWTYLAETFDWRGVVWVVGLIFAVVLGLTVSRFMDSLGPEEGTDGRGPSLRSGKGTEEEAPPPGSEQPRIQAD